MRNIKVGDRFYCIKNRWQYNNNSAGKLYSVKMFDKKVDSNTIWVDNEESSSSYYYVFEGSHQYIFDEYFISLEKSRKLKLKKINEGRR